MPQGPLQANVAVNQTTLKSVPLQSDMSGNLLVGSGSMSKLNVTGTTVIKAAPGRICKINIMVVPSVVVTVNDCTTAGAVATANQVCAIPIASAPAGTTIPLDFPCLTGIVLVLGTGTASVSYD